MRRRLAARRFALAFVFLAGAPLVAAAQTGPGGLDDEIRDRILISLQQRGGLAPGTRPKCFPAHINDTVAAARFQCPTAAPNGQQRFPSAQSLWGILGRY